MSSALQNRLVGTIIVVALVVIVLPEFIDGEKRTNQQTFVDIPGRGELVEVMPVEGMDTNEIEQALNRPVEIVDETPVDEPSNFTDELTPSTHNPAQAATDSSQGPDQAPAGNETLAPTTVSQQTSNNTLPSSNKPAGAALGNKDALDEIAVTESAWVLQLGSFRHEKNVKELLKTLNNAGYRAYSRPVMTNVGELTKVFVGPELDKSKLELALPHLQEITQLKGKITAFEVSAG